MVRVPYDRPDGALDALADALDALHRDGRVGHVGAEGKTASGLEPVTERQPRVDDIEAAIAGVRPWRDVP